MSEGATSDRGRLPPLPELEANARDQAALLAAAGCDLLVLEMLHDVDVSRYVAAACPLIQSNPIRVTPRHDRLPT